MVVTFFVVKSIKFTINFLINLAKIASYKIYDFSTETVESSFLCSVFAQIVFLNVSAP